MINGFQKLIYKMSCIAPVSVFLAITLFMQGTNIVVCILLGLFGLASMIYSYIFIKLCEKKLPVLKITIDSISQDDSSVLVSFVAYLTPLVGIVWKNDIIVWILIAGSIFVVLIKVGDLGFCPVLLLAGYHCYRANLSTGMVCVLISRRRGMRSSKQVTQVVKISDTLMLEYKEGEQ